MISKLLAEFVEKADSHVIGEAPLGSSRQIIIENLGGPEYRGLNVKGSFGMGRATAVPWIGFFGYGQKTEQGIYPAFLYFKEQKTVVLAYAVSETRTPDKVWTDIEGKKTVAELFRESGFAPPARYGDSYVESVFRADVEFDEAQVATDLARVIDRYEYTFRGYDAGAKTTDSGSKEASIAEQVMIYEVKSTARENAEKLFNQELQKFYWNDRFFRTLEIGDFVFIVNRHTPFILFTKVEARDISVNHTEQTSTFEDLGQSYEVAGTWDKFVRLHVINQLTPPNDWYWTTLGSTEIVY